MRLLFEIFVYIFFTYGFFACIFTILYKIFSINIRDIHKNMNGNEKVEVIVVFRNIDKYERYV